MTKANTDFKDSETIADENTLGNKLTFKNLAGLEKEIELLKEFFYNPFEYSDLYANIGVETNKGILLYGPSGCGKTTLARATSNEFKHTFIELKISDIYSR